MNKSLALALALASMGAALPAAQAAGNGDSGDWILRARALHLDSANKDSTGLGLTVNNKTFLEVDITRFLNENLALELILALPQKHTISTGTGRIGTLKHLPPTLTLQYHFTGLPAVRPYLGAGLNYTRFMNVQFDAAVVTALNPSIKKNSFGLALQAGLDVPMGDGWLFNVDVKKVQIRTDVFAGTTKAGTFRVDPTLFSLGFGKRF
jgi:outer membrane protein